MSASVLVVDDDADHRFLTERKLRGAGHDVRCVASGEEALGALDGVDIVLLDYRLPGLGGMETLRAMRRRKGPSVVMVTGMGSETLVVEAIRAGAIDYVVKDGSYLSQLPNVVERAWRMHDLERRTGELQRLALVVSSASSRDRALAEIVAGAQRLLRSDGCQLFLEEQLVASVGVPCEELSGVGSQVRIPVDEQGELVLCRREGPDFDSADVELAVTFSSFAAIALAKASQLDLERRLVEELQETLKVRRQLVSSVTHELRTPLTSIIGFAATLMQHWARLPDEEKVELLSRIHANGQELKDLIDRLLDFSYIESGRLQPTPGELDLAVEVKAAVDALAPLLADRMVAIDVPSLWVRADATLLRRTLWNLLTNAAKYAPDHSAIAVRAHVGGSSDGVDPSDVVVEVVDTGEGMTEDEAARVFEPFWRSDRVRTRQRGTGLGLALVRDYTRLMGGDVGVKSELGHGSTFWFTLPSA